MTSLGHKSPYDSGTALTPLLVKTDRNCTQVLEPFFYLIEAFDKFTLFICFICRKVQRAKFCLTRSVKKLN